MFHGKFTIFCIFLNIKILEFELNINVSRETFIDEKSDGVLLL